MIGKIEELISTLEEAGASKEQIKEVLRDKDIAPLIKSLLDGEVPSEEELEVAKVSVIQGMLSSARDSIDWASVSALELQESHTFFVALASNITQAVKMDREDVIGKLAVELMGTTITNMGNGA